MAERPQDRSQGQASESGPKSAINITNAKTIVIGDYSAVSLDPDAYEEITQATKQDPCEYVQRGQHHGSEICCDVEHTNKNTGLICQNCGATRRNTTDCTHKAERPRIDARPNSCCGNPSFRPRAQQIQFGNHSLQSKYAAGRSASRRPTAAYRIINCPQEGMLHYREFVKRIDTHLEDLAKATGEERKEREQFIVHVLLPKLEHSCTEWCEVEETSLVVAKLSCARINDVVTLHALELLLQLVSQNKLESHADKLQQIERIIRSSIASDSFNEEKPELQEKRVVVLSHLLMLSLSEISRNNYLHFTPKDEAELNEVVAILGKRFRSRPEHKRTMDNNPHLKLALDIVSEAVHRLLANSSLGKQHWQFLEKFNSVLWPADDPNKAKKNTKLQKKLSSQSWFDVVFAIYHINGQGIRKIPPTEKMRKIRFLVGGCTKERKILKFDQASNHNNEFLAAVIVLFDIMTQYRDNKFIQLEAMQTLTEWHQTALNGGFSISPTIVDEIKRYLWMTLFWRNTGAIAAEHLFDLRFPTQEIPQVYIEEYLEWFHKCYSLEMRGYTHCDAINNCYFIKKGFFRGVPSVSKILRSRVGEIGQRMVHSKVLADLITEAHYLYKLSSNPHQNIVQLLAFNTNEPPYHIITEYVAGGTLQSYFKNCRENGFSPSQSFLIDICLCVAKGALFLSRQGLVHRGLTLANILIGGDGVCKITGMETVRQLRPNSSNGNDSSVEEKKNTATESIPEYKSVKEDYPITHAAPESVREGRFSAASDVWGFGVLMWEVMTYGCAAFSTPINGVSFLGNSTKIKKYIQEGKKLPKEACFYEETYSLMEECWNTDPMQRPSFEELIQKLEHLYESFKGSESAPATPPTMPGSVEDLEYGSEEHNQKRSTAIYSEPTMVKGQPQYINNTMSGNISQGVIAGSRGYMPLSGRHEESYQFPISKDTQSMSRPFILGQPPAPNASHKRKMGDKENSSKTLTEKLEELTLRQRIQSLGKPVLPQSLIQQSPSNQVVLNGKEKMKSRFFSTHQENEIEKESYVNTTSENGNKLVENAAGIDDGFGDMECYEPNSVDTKFCHNTSLRCSYDCHLPIYENLPKHSWASPSDKENERPDSGSDLQETYECPWADTNPNEDERSDSGLDFEDTECYDDISSYQDEPIYEAVGN